MKIFLLLKIASKHKSHRVIHEFIHFYMLKIYFSRTILMELLQIFLSISFFLPLSFSIFHFIINFISCVQNVSVFTLQGSTKTNAKSYVIDEYNITTISIKALLSTNNDGQVNGTLNNSKQNKMKNS